MQTANQDKSPGDQETRDELQRVLSSDAFSRSARLSTLLAYLVEEDLAGRGDRIKAFSIAQDVYDRDASFDQQNDAIVRVEAGRLRRRLESYYLDEGKDHPVRIEIPRGSYRPIFSFVELGTSPGADPGTKVSEAGNQTGAYASPEKFSTRRASILALFVAAALVAGWIFIDRPGRVAVPESPFVAVIPIEHSGAGLSPEIAAGVEESIYAALNDVPDVRVMASSSSGGIRASGMSLEQLRNELGLTHIVEGALDIFSNTARVYLKITNTGDQDVSWAETFGGSIDDRFALQDLVAGNVATSLEILTGSDPQARVYIGLTGNREALAKFREAKRLIYPINSAERAATAEALFSRVVELDPDFAGGHAGLAMVPVYRALFQPGGDARENALEALEHAQRAIELDPDFGLAHGMLSAAYRVTGQEELSMKHARMAVALDPSDPQSHQNLASALIWYGHNAEAIPYLEEALRLDPLEARTPYLNLLGLARFNLGDYQGALDAFLQNQERGGPDGPHMVVYRIAAFHQMGMFDEASTEASAHIQGRPGFPLRRWVSQWSPNAEVEAMIVELAARYGVEIADPSG